MKLSEDTKQELLQYVSGHLRAESWHLAFFDFIDDETLAKRLGEEFISIRYIYKLLLAINPEGWLKRAQVRAQILSYASIYEAVLHHLLFKKLKDESAVVKLMKVDKYNRISIPPASLSFFAKHLKHAEKAIIPMYKSEGKTESSKVRFDGKVKCAVALGIIELPLGEELIEIYEARNAIHIDAEIRKNFQYELKLSTMAYRRLQPFKDQIVAWLKKSEAALKSE